MRISHRHRFIFFANPKTGSSSVRQFLDPYADVRPARNYLTRTPHNPFYPHMTPREVREVFRRYRWDFEGYTKFVFVRNPWARLVSLYSHIRRSEALPCFAEWLSTVQSDGPGGGGESWQRWRRYGTYSIQHFITDERGEIEQALRPFLASLGLTGLADKPVQHRNRRLNGPHYTTFYTAESAAIVRDRYRYDIETYGYRFGA
jgi:hypothetical protein